MARHIVIVGGMGPQASLELHRRVIDRAADLGARDGHEYPRISHLSVPIRDLIASADGGAEALAELVEAVRGVRLDGDTAVVLACNTAHLLRTEFELAVGHPVASLVDNAVAVARSAGVATVGILASPTALASGLYADPLRRAGIAVCEPSTQDLDDLERVIRDLTANGPVSPAVPVVAVLVDRLVAAGAERVILGCTELSLVAPRLGRSDLIDPLAVIVDALLPTAVSAAGG